MTPRRTARTRRLSHLLLIGMTTLAAAATHGETTAAPACADTGSQTWWQCIRAQREAAIGDYIANNKTAFVSFKNAPLASKKALYDFVGIPMMMFRLLPVLFPEYWGTPEQQMSTLGLGPDPFEPGTVMPLGTGYALSTGFKVPNRRYDWQINYATLTCMACHSGAVTGPGGETLRQIGGTNELGDFFGAINKTVNDPRYTVENFRTALAREPLGWVYENPAMIPQEFLERRLFGAPGGAEYFLSELKFISNKSAARIRETLDAYTYNVPNAPPLATMPGSLDVFAFAAANLTNPAKLTPAEVQAALPASPAPSDIPAAWGQINRPRYQWDDSIGNLSYREVAASLTVSAGDPASVNLDNVTLAGGFVENLPPAPYPFDVDRDKAMRGAAIYQRACLGCHMPGNPTLQAPSVSGTDPNRAFVYTSYLLTNFIAQLRAACTIPSCFGPGGSALPDSTILQPTGAYAAIPLAGLWSTAPYLHNGSVPTLRHLLTGERPTTFYRANTTYDQRNVGYTWDRAETSRATLYDTTDAGYSNAGHTGPDFNGGIDWKQAPQMLEDLLEYLKTL